MRTTTLAMVFMSLLSSSAQASVELGTVVKEAGRTWYPQTVGGLRVVGRGIVSIKTLGGRSLARSNVREDIPSFAVSMRADEAYSRVLAQVPNAGAMTRSELVISESPLHGFRPVWRVRGSMKKSPSLSQLEYEVDAQTGAVLGAHELVKHLTASAKVYPTNPAKSPTMELLELPLQPTAPLASNEITSFNCMDRRTVRSMFGQRVHVCDLVQDAQPDVDGHYTPTPDDDPNDPAHAEDTYSQVSMYYHTARAISYFRMLRGDVGAQVTADMPISVVANLRLDPGIEALFNGSGSGNTPSGNPDVALVPYDNAFFYPGGSGSPFQSLFGISGGGLFFGQGRQRDYAYDGDVVYHELTHAVVDHSLQLEGAFVEPWGLSGQPGAMNEALADYFSSAIAGDPEVGEYAGSSIGGSSPIRTLDNADSCPGQVGGQVHYDSTLFSGGLWSTRKALADDAARVKFDAIVYAAMRLHPGSAHIGYHEFVNMVLDVARTEMPEAVTPLTTEMTKRGVLPECAPLIRLKDAIYTDGPDMFGGFKAFSGPGASSTGLGTTPGIVQFVAPVVSRPGSKVNISFEWSSGFGGGGSSSRGSAILNVLFDKPLTWSQAGLNGYDNDGEKFTGSGRRVSVDIPVPEGAKEVYFQVSNGGQRDFYYSSVISTSIAGKLSLDAGAGDAGAGDAGNNNGNVELGGELGGGGCSTGGQSSGFAGLAAAFALAAASVLRARRSSTPQA